MQEKRELLRQWVESNGDAAAVEAQIVISKTNSNKYGKTKELLTVAEMKKKDLLMRRFKRLLSVEEFLTRTAPI